jgi:hypothetical protein
MNDTILNLLLVYVALTLFLALMIIREQLALVSMYKNVIDQMHNMVEERIRSVIRHASQQQGNYGHGQNLN